MFRFDHTVSIVPAMKSTPVRFELYVHMTFVMIAPGSILNVGVESVQRVNSEAIQRTVSDTMLFDFSYLLDTLEMNPEYMRSQFLNLSEYIVIFTISVFITPVYQKGTSRSIVICH